MKYGRVLASGVFASACIWAQSGNPNKSDLPGGTPAQQITRKAAQTRRENELSVPYGESVFHGILIDGGCRDGEMLNLRRPPESLLQEAPAQPANAAQNNPPPTGAVSAQGISVNGATINAERAGVMEPRVPGMFERQADPTCAITASTTSFALLTDDGRLLDLDQGGNTLALIAVQSTSGGRALLNGQGPGVKPRVVVKGQIRGESLIAQDVKTAGS